MGIGRGVHWKGGYLMFKRLFAALLALSISGAFAQAVPATSSAVVGFTTSVAGNATTFTGGAVNAANAASFAFAPASNSAVYATAPGKYFNGTQMVDVAVRSKVTPIRAAGAISRFASKALPIGYALGVGVALYDLAKELGWDIEGGAGDVPVISQSSVVYRYFSDFCTATSAPGQALEAFVYSCQGPTFARTSSPVNCAQTGGYMTCTHTDVWGGSRTSYYSLVLPTTGAPVPKTAQEFADAIAAESGWPSASAIARALNDAIKYGETVQLEPDLITGPAESPGPKQVTDDGTNITEKETKNKYTYDGNKVSNKPETVTTVTDKATGSVVSTTTQTTTPESSSPPAPEIDIETCGLPGKPACKIDEEGTPEAKTDSEYHDKLDPFKTEMDSNRDVIGGASDKPFFDGWSLFFSAPAVVACQPYELPRDMGSIDACGVVDGVRTIMGYIWALTALYLCIGMVREVS